MKADYAELIGKEIIFINYGDVYTARVVDCHYDIGITLINDDNTNEILMCLRSPTRIVQKAVAKGKRAEDVNDKTHKHYDAVFHAIVGMIKDGKYTDRVTEAILGEKTTGDFKIDSSVCAFS